MGGPKQRGIVQYGESCGRRGGRTQHVMRGGRTGTISHAERGIACKAEVAVAGDVGVADLRYEAKTLRSLIYEKMYHGSCPTAELACRTPSTWAKALSLGPELQRKVHRSDRIVHPSTRGRGFGQQMPRPLLGRGLGMLPWQHAHRNSPIFFISTDDRYLVEPASTYARSSASVRLLRLQEADDQASLLGTHPCCQ